MLDCREGREVAITITRPEPGPAADAARQQYWALAYHLADERLRREAIAAAKAARECQMQREPEAAGQ